MAGDARPFGELFAEGTRNGLTRPKAVRGAGVKMVNMGELFAYPRLRNAPMDRVPLSDVEAEKFLLEPGDLLFARQSLVLEGAGKCSIFLNDDESVTFESHVTRVRLDPQKADPRFYFYYLQSHHGRAAIRSIVEQGAGASGIRGSDLERLDVLWRPVAEQRAIAHILDTLDDKIELNRRMNETLEAMARALFKSWFVDFDPVRAKAEGRDPGLPQPLADLFPNSFEDSDLGELPMGWRGSVLGEEASRCGGMIQTGPFGSQLHASDYVPDGVPVVMPKDLLQRRVSTLSIARVSSSDADRLSRHRLREGDIVYSRRGDVERHGLVRSRETGWLCGTGCLLVRLGPKWPSTLFASLALDRPESRAWIVQHAIGATMPNLNTGILGRVPIIVPPDDVLRAFDRVAQPLADKIIAADFQTEILWSLRDTLLPRLLSGDVRVKGEGPP